MLLVGSAFIMSPLRMTSGSLGIADCDVFSNDLKLQGDDSMKSVMWCLVAGAAMLLPAAAQAKDCCKPVKVKCCKPVKVKCCKPTCCQAPAPCCAAGAAAAAAAPTPSAADAKKAYEEKAAPPPPTEKKAEEKK